MIGFNSALLGVRRVPTTGSASGLWVPNEQVLARRAGIWPVTGGDPDFADVSLLLPFNGANSSIVFTDVSNNAVSVTVTGGAEISTTQSKYGGSSGFFNGTNARLELPASSLFNFPADFTVELWVYAQSQSTSFSTLLEIGSFSNGILLRPGTDIYVNNVVVIGSGFTLTTGTWHHLAVVRSGTTVTIYKDGTSIASSTITGTINSTSSSSFICDSTHSPGRFYHAYVDDLRITKGVARYTANFTPPTAAFPDF
jgi:hypothetical protein